MKSINPNELIDKTIDRIETVDWNKPDGGYESAIIFFKDGTSLEITAGYDSNYREGFFNFYPNEEANNEPKT